MGNYNSVQSSGTHSDNSKEKSCPVSHETISTFSNVNDQPKGCTSDNLENINVISSHGYRVDTEQITFPDGSKPLSNIVVSSTIPKGGTDNETWHYPSPQRFYNAMKKKGFNPNPEDMQAVVSIHNTVNEKCWQEIMEYEKFHFDTCPNPKLLKFRGRPDDYSPRARLAMFLGYQKPFDRHDWIVDRCGKEVRYILDFYKGEEVENKPVSIHLDIRPALTFEGFIDRMRRIINR